MNQTAFRAQRFYRGEVQKLSVVWETGLLEVGNDGSAKPRLPSKATCSQARHIKLAQAGAFRAQYPAGHEQLILRPRPKQFPV